MKPDLDVTSAVRALWGSTRADQRNTDYTLLAEIEGAYVARSRGGLPALLVPLPDVSASSLGRRASGCELLGHPVTRFVFQGKDRVGPAAALLCNDAELVDAFAVFALDVAKRVRAQGASWAGMLACVQEWQTLLTPRGRPSPEAELGLWGELWFLAQAEDIHSLLTGWRGPEGDKTDFFLGGKGVEIKTSRAHRQHDVSLSQVASPLGDCEAWLLSIWVAPDPASANTVERLAVEILARVQDRADALRRLARAGYSPADKSSYGNAFVVLAAPEWYPATVVPRVRVVDPGVSHLRYRVALDESTRMDSTRSAKLWRHFHGHDQGQR